MTAHEWIAATYPDVARPGYGGRMSTLYDMLVAAFNAGAVSVVLRRSKTSHAQRNQQEKSK